jgi:four helix bundle protein
MRNPRSLKAFHLADDLALRVYRATTEFPRSEQYGLVSQLRQAAVSCASNIVEGCARPGKANYIHFLDIAYGSACELQYQVSLAARLGYLNKSDSEALASACEETTRVLNGLICALRRRCGDNSGLEPACENAGPEA